MISEPEFDGGSGGSPEPREVHGPHAPRGAPVPHEPLEPHDALAPRVRGVRLLRPGPGPWRWALGGALLASALWAGAWWAVSPQDHRPPLRYALTPSLCDGAKLPALARLTQTAGWDYTPRRWEHPGVDRALCVVRKPPPGSDEPGYWLSYEAQVSVALHKRTDPAPEFGADPGVVDWIGAGTPDLRSVAGLGDRALISEAEYGRWWRLTVLDGGAVFTLDVTAWTGGDGGDGGTGEAPVSAGTGPPEDPPKPDSDAIQAAMIEDMHGLMKALHSRARGARARGGARG
ncbi:hypothetical protein OG389_24305 [Streptomyces sp. NBC_00435]|uniref:hypothetical protein n=1 Tax=Streptomyces sp. NBC_00435 TaxID=2903649 RepID=UPI002E1B5C93